MLSKFLQLIKSRQHEIYLGSCVALIAIISYNLGQINSLKKTPISIKQGTMDNKQDNKLKADIFDAAKSEPNSKQLQNSKLETKLDTRVVASKNSDKYHYSWCSGAKRIKPENQIWFNSAQEAEAKGYVLAGNCTK